MVTERELREANQRTRNFEKETKAKKKQEAAESKKKQKEPKKEAPRTLEQANADIAAQKEERARKAQVNWHVSQRNRMIHDLKHEPINEEGAPFHEDIDPKQGKDLVDIARRRQEGKNPKLANDLPRSSWNRGFDKRMTPNGYRTKEVIGEDGRKATVWEKVPGPNDRIVTDKEIQRPRDRKMGRAVKGFEDKELAKKPINEKVVNRLTDLKNYLEWLENGGEDKDGLKESLSLLKTELEKFGHTDLVEKMDEIDDIDDVEQFVKIMNARLGILERRKIPDLRASVIPFKDGHEEIVYHMPMPSPRKKLKIRPGFTSEVKTRPHGHEGAEGREVTQKIWTKDPDFVKGGIINRGDYKFDPDAEITEVKEIPRKNTNEFSAKVVGVASYSDGSRAFIKSDSPDRLRNEYGISKFFETTFADKLGFTIPRVNIIPTNKAGDKLAQFVGDNKELMRSEFVDAYPIDLIDTELSYAIKENDIVDAALFSLLVGNHDLNEGNIMVGADGRITLVDLTNAKYPILDNNRTYAEIPWENYGAFHALMNARYKGELEIDGEIIYGDIIEPSLGRAKEVVRMFADIGVENIIDNILQNTEIDESTYEKYKEIIQENFRVLYTEFLGTEQEKQELQAWWDEARQERLKEAPQEEEPSTPEEESTSPEESLGDDKERLAQVLGNARQANAIVEEIRRKTMAEMEAKYKLEPKVDKPLKEHNEAKPKELEKPKYTMSDLFQENMARQKQGLKPYKSVEEMIADKHPDEPILDEIPEDAEVVEPEKKPVEPVRFKPLDESEIPDIKREEEKPPEKIDYSKASTKQVLDHIRQKNAENGIKNSMDVKRDEKGNILVGQAWNIRKWKPSEVLKNEPVFDFDIPTVDSEQDLGTMVKSHLSASYFHENNEDWLVGVSESIANAKDSKEKFNIIDREVAKLLDEKLIHGVLDDVKEYGEFEINKATKAFKEWMNEDMEKVKEDVFKYASIRSDYEYKNDKFRNTLEHKVISNRASEIEKIVLKRMELADKFGVFEGAVNDIDDKHLTYALATGNFKFINRMIDMERLSKEFNEYQIKLRDEALDMGVNVSEMMPMMSKHNSLVSSIFSKAVELGVELSVEDLFTYSFTNMPRSIKIDRDVVLDNTEKVIEKYRTPIGYSLIDMTLGRDESKAPKLALDIADTIRNGSVEHHFIFDDKNIFLRDIGTTSKVAAQFTAAGFGAYTIHNHPSAQERGADGFTTFSPADIQCAAASGLKSCYVTGGRVTAFINAPKGGWDNAYFFGEFMPSFLMAKSEIKSEIYYQLSMEGVKKISKMTRNRIMLKIQHMALEATCNSLGIEYGVIDR